MADTANEDFDWIREGMSIGQAAAHVRSIRRDGPVSPSCVWRWIRNGFEMPDGRIVRLEARRFCGRWVTTRRALQRFFDEQQTPTAHNHPLSTSATGGARRRAVAQAEKELLEHGL